MGEFLDGVEEHWSSSTPKTSEDNQFMKFLSLAYLDF